MRSAIQISTKAARCLLLPVLVLDAICLQAQTEPQAEVRLEPHDGKTRFQIGEPIRLALVISNPAGTPMMVNTTDYGDNSDPLEITPQIGWIAWQGRSGHDYAQMTELGREPIRIPIRVDQVAIFRQPGHYEVRVTENRVQNGGDLFHLSPTQVLTTKPLGIDLEEMPDEREAEIVRGILNDLANATGDRVGSGLSQAAVRRLAALQGNIALEEKVKLLTAEQRDFRSVETEAWATTRDLKRQLDLLEAAWRNPQITPAYDMPSALDQTRRLLAGRRLAGWQMVAAPTEPNSVEQHLAAARQQDMVDLLNSMPQRTGESRREAAYLLVEFGGLPEGDEALAREYAVEEFALMDDTSQHMLLETPRPSFRDARLLPVLRTLLDRDPADKDALAAFLDLAQEQATPFVISAVCAPVAPPLIDAFAKVKEDRLPQVDACLLPLLQGQKSTKDTGRANFAWKQRVILAARFGTPALLPAIEASSAQQLAANPNDSGVTGALLGAEMRDDPNAAVVRLQHGLSSAVSWFETNQVYESARQSFAPVVETWLRDQVLHGDNDAAGQAAYELSVGGTPKDRAVIEQRLAVFRLHAPDGGNGSPSRAEVELVSALFGGKAWTLTAEERSALKQGCVTDACRQVTAP